jgi:hypothetical protein
MPTLHYTKDDRVEHFHIFGYFKEFTDKKTRQYLGHQFLEEIDSNIKMGAEAMHYETHNKNLKLKSGFKEITVDASNDNPLEVEVFYNFACGRVKK